jgi:hypothetical protein
MKLSHPLCIREKNMSQPLTENERPNAWQITLTAKPKAQPAQSTGTLSHITAKVENRFTHRPAENVLVTFSSPAARINFSHTSVRTDRQGNATTRLTYPHPATTGYDGGNLIPVCAAIGDELASLTLIFYSESLAPVTITNLHDGHVIDQESIDAGVQAVIYPCADSVPGNIYTLFWGDKRVERAYDGKNFPWVIDIGRVFGAGNVWRNGDYTVFYQLCDNAGNPAESRPLEVSVRCAAPQESALVETGLPSELLGVDGSTGLG